MKNNETLNNIQSDVSTLAAAIGGILDLVRNKYEGDEEVATLLEWAHDKACGISDTLDQNLLDTERRNAALFSQ